MAVTIRTDRYQALQTAPQLAGVGTVLFDELKPMPRTQFKEVITGPAARATEGGRPLQLEPVLVNRLLDDCTEGADTLPLLALTLARLYEDYASDGTLSLPEYLSMGGIQSVVHTEMDSLLAPDAEQRGAAAAAAAQPHSFHGWPRSTPTTTSRCGGSRGGPSSRSRVVRCSRSWLPKGFWSKTPATARWSSRSRWKACLRQWDDLARWLAEQREDLKNADSIERGALAWERNHRDDAWLLQGTRLTDAENLGHCTRIPGPHAPLPRLPGRLPRARERAG